MDKKRIAQIWAKWRERINRLPFLEDRITRYLVYTLALGLLVAALGFVIYDRVHLFDDYSVIASGEVSDVDGTLYRILGSHVIKYSHDGVFCVDTGNSVKWSSAFSMQTPISDSCGGRMVIAEQQGKQVYVLSEEGVTGAFESSLPIISAHVSATGVVALVLDDAEVTWVNLYQEDGSQIAAVKTTMGESGYPVSVAITSDAKQMMISFLQTESGQLTGRLGFYDFTSAEEADEDHLTGEAVYEDMIFPQVYYGDGNVPVAVADKGYVVFSGGREPKEQKKVAFEDEVVSVFHDGSSVGFVFRSDQTDSRYQMRAYNLSGRQTMETGVDFAYQEIRMDRGEILLYDASDLYVYRTSGKAKLKVTYKKGVRYFASLPGSRKYLVITDDSMDRIRIS